MSNRFIERPRSFCALGGALLSTVALPGVVPILHASMGCGGSIYWNQQGSTGHLGAGYCGGLAVPSSNVQEKDIVFGGDERLREQIKNTIKLVEGDLYIVLTGCMTDIIGDDINAIIREFQADGVKIIGAETGGFKGDGYKGYDLLLEALITNFIERKNDKIKNKVNLWGIVPGQDAFWRGNLRILKGLLNKLGLTVNTFFSEEDSLEDIKNAADASLNIIVSEFYGLDAAESFVETHGVPYLSTPLPIGPTATAEFLTKVSSVLGIDHALVKNIIEEENKRYFKYIERVADAYNDLDLQRYAVVVGDGNYAPALTKFLADDLGWLPELTVVSDFFEEKKFDKVNQTLQGLASGYRTNLIFETDASEIQAHFSRLWPRSKGQRYYDAFSPAFVIGSHQEREFAKKIGAAHLTVSYPVGNRVILGRGYAGFEGSLYLIEDLFSVLVAER